MPDITAYAIRNACHKVLAMGSLLPRNGVTYCNIGTWLILNELGLAAPFRLPSSRIMLANEMHDLLAGAYTEIDMEQAYTYTQSGIYVCVAASKGKEHGHVAVCYPFPNALKSAKWDGLFVPAVANIGLTNGIMGANYAFGDKPRFFKL